MAQDIKENRVVNKWAGLEPNAEEQKEHKNVWKEIEECIELCVKHYKNTEKHITKSTEKRLSNTRKQSTEKEKKKGLQKKKSKNSVSTEKHIMKTTKKK